MPITPTIALPGYVPDVNDGDPVTAGHDDAVRDRAFQIFATAALRDAAIVTPQVGQMSIITVGSGSGLDIGEYEYVGPVLKWTRPWGRSWGEIARTRDVTTQTVASAVETVIAAAATLFTAVANRNYRIEAKGSLANLTASPQSLTLRVKDGVTLLENELISALTGMWAKHTCDFVVGTFVAGVHTINVTMQSSGASGVSVCPSGGTTPFYVIVTDIGPAGAPA
jgi:hypothetical protein